MIKIDVQGAELDVLQGGINILNDIEYIILETVMFQVFSNGSKCYDIIKFMKEQGFVVYEIFDPIYRPLDGAMSQLILPLLRKEVNFVNIIFMQLKNSVKCKIKRLFPKLSINRTV